MPKQIKLTGNMKTLNIVDDRVTEPVCIVDGHFGVYVPQTFVERNDPVEWGFEKDDEDWAILLKGPDNEGNEHYWDAWETISNNAKKDGCYLYQDSDLFMVPEGWDTESWTMGVSDAE